VKIYEHFKNSGCHDRQYYSDDQLWRYAEKALVTKRSDPGLFFPDDLQKADDEEIAIYFATPHGPFEPKKRPRVPVFRDSEADEGADRPLTRPKLFAKAAYDSGVAMAQVICAGRSCCYSKTIAGDVAAVRIKRTGYSVPLAVYRKG